MSREVIFEWRYSGNMAQIFAVDVETGTEVFVTTPKNINRADGQKLALARLNQKMASLSQQTQTPKPPKLPNSTGGGWIA